MQNEEKYFKGFRVTWDWDKIEDKWEDRSILNANVRIVNELKTLLSNFIFEYMKTDKRKILSLNKNNKSIESF